MKRETIYSAMMLASKIVDRYTIPVSDFAKESYASRRYQRALRQENTFRAWLWKMDTMLLWQPAGRP